MLQPRLSHRRPALELLGHAVSWWCPAAFLVAPGETPGTCGPTGVERKLETRGTECDRGQRASSPEANETDWTPEVRARTHARARLQTLFCGLARACPSRLCESQLANLSREHGFAWSRHVMTRHVRSRRVVACLLVSRFRAVTLCRVVSHRLPRVRGRHVICFTIASPFRALSCPRLCHVISSHLLFPELLVCPRIFPSPVCPPLLILLVPSLIPSWAEISKTKKIKHGPPEAMVFLNLGLAPPAFKNDLRQ